MDESEILTMLASYGIMAPSAEQGLKKLLDDFAKGRRHILDIHDEKYTLKKRVERLEYALDNCICELRMQKPMSSSSAAYYQRALEGK